MIENALSLIASKQSSEHAEKLEIKFFRRQTNTKEINMKICFLKLAMVISTIFVSNVLGNAQENTKKFVDPFENLVPKVTKRSGWQVPQIKKLIFIREGSRESNGLVIEVKTYRHKYDNERLNLENYFLYKDEGLFIGMIANLQVRDVYTRAVKGKVYSFVVTYHPLSISSEGLREYAGAIFTRSYFDEDGDGKFEIMYQKPEIVETETIPD